MLIKLSIPYDSEADDCRKAMSSHQWNFCIKGSVTPAEKPWFFWSHEAPSTVAVTLIESPPISASGIAPHPTKWVSLPTGKDLGENRRLSSLRHSSTPPLPPNREKWSCGSMPHLALNPLFSLKDPDGGAECCTRTCKDTATIAHFSERTQSRPQIEYVPADISATSHLGMWRPEQL